MPRMRNPKTLAQAVNQAQAPLRRAARNRSTLTLGEWTLEARPDGLHVTHGPTGTATLLAPAPTDEGA